MLMKEIKESDFDPNPTNLKPPNPHGYQSTWVLKHQEVSWVKKGKGTGERSKTTSFFY